MKLFLVDQVKKKNISLALANNHSKCLLEMVQTENEKNQKVKIYNKTSLSSPTKLKN